MSTQFTEERALWLYQHYKWLEKRLPKRQSLANADLVVPTARFFPDRYANDLASAEILFGRVKFLMGMETWACRLEQYRDEDKDMQDDLSKSGLLGRFSSKGAAGTFSMSGNGDVVISYSASALKDPNALIATFCHELCHYLLARVVDEPPATWKELEPLTDLSAVIEGFGLFLCNTAFQFKQWNSYDSQGWSYSRKGYLTEAELGFSLAIFCVRNRLDAGLAAQALKPNPRVVFRDALDYIVDLEEDESQGNP